MKNRRKTDPGYKSPASAAPGGTGSAEFAVQLIDATKFFKVYGVGGIERNKKG